MYNLVCSILPYGPLKFEAPFNLLPKCLVTFQQVCCSPAQMCLISLLAEKKSETLSTSWYSRATL